MSEVSNIPQLRFPEFSGDWEEKELGDISTKIMYGIGSAATKYDGVNKYLRITDIDDSSRSFAPKPLTSPEGFIDDRYRLSSGDLVFARTGASVGKSYLYKKNDGNLIFAGFLIKFNISNAEPYFVYSNTFRGAYDNWVSVMSVRSGQPGINAEEYKILPIKLPTKPEQTKIAAFLTTVDNKIEQLSKKQELLGEYKKGLMQQIFSQAIRFKADDGSDFPDWRVGELSNLIEISSNKFNPNTSNESKKCIELEHLSQETGELLGYTDSTEQASTKNAFTKGQVLFGKLRPYLKKFWLSQFDGVCSSEIWVLNGKELTNSYLFQFVQTNKFNQIANVSSGSKMPRSDWKYMAQVPFKYTTLPEQQKIANFLSSIDNKIEKVGKQLDESKQFKKALLQQMFV